MMIPEHPEDPPSYNAISTTVVSPPTYSPPLYSSGRETAKGVPPGLQDLLQVNQLCIQERFSVSQRWARSFDVLDGRGRRVYQANQHVECCGPNFDLRVRDSRGDRVMDVIERNCCGCSREAEVTLPDTECLGFVTFPSNNFVTHLSIMDSSREVLLLILGPSLKISIFGNISFEVKSRDDQYVVGMIRSEGNQYTVIFPMDLEVTMKAMIMASCFYLGPLHDKPEQLCIEDSIIYDQKRSITDHPSSS